MNCPHCNNLILRAQVYFICGRPKCHSCCQYLDGLEITVDSTSPITPPPTVLHKNVHTGEYSFPGHIHDPVPAGYVREEIPFHALDRITKGLSARAKAERQMNIAQEKAYWDQRTKILRERVDQDLARLGISSALKDKIRQYRDRKREKKYAELSRRDVNVYSQIREFDSSNRQPHASEHTGWKQVKR